MPQERPEFVDPHPDEALGRAESGGKGRRSVHDIPDLTQVFRSWRRDLVVLSLLILGGLALLLGGLVLLVIWLAGPA